MKYYIIAVITLFSSLKLMSQDLTYGIEVGTSMSLILELNPINKGYGTYSEGQLGLYVGGFVNYKISNKLGIYGSLAFDNRKSNFSIDENNPLIVNHNYLVLNPSLKWSFSEYNKGFYLRPGLKYALFLSSKEEENQLEILNDFNGLFSVNLGFGYDVNNFIGLELFLDYSLNDVLADSSSKLMSGTFRVNINLQQILNN